MKSRFLFLTGLAGAVFLALLALPSPSHGDPAADLAATTALIDDLTLQQAKLIGNHAKLDAKIGEIAEEVRQARLFVARGGGKSK